MKCPDCNGLGYLGGEGTDVPSTCMNKIHKLALSESFERVAKVAEERAAFNAGIEAAALEYSGFEIREKNDD
jgi:hypothetical protein